MKVDRWVLAFVISTFVSFAASADCQVSTPLFDLSGPTCSPAKLLAPCECSEALQWDPVPKAMWYEVQRTPIPSGYTIMVGTTQRFNRADYYDDDGVLHLGDVITYWYFAWDCIDHTCAFTTAGQSYNYRVRSCRVNAAGTKLCSSWGVTTTYTAAPYYCYDNGVKVPC